MNRSMIIGTIVGAVAVTAIGSWAGLQALDSTQYAEVIAAEPAMKVVSVPREECHDQVVTTQKPVKDKKRITGTITGAVIGGVLGNQVGGGRGNTIATAAGAAGGAYAGNKIQENAQEKNVEQQVKTTCTTVNDQHEEQDGFNVTYRLNGQENTIHMNYNPGPKIPVENGVLMIDPAS